MTTLIDDQKVAGNPLILAKEQPRSQITTQVKRKKNNDDDDEDHLNSPNKKKNSYLPFNMLNGYRTEHHRDMNEPIPECPVAPLANMGNTCFLNSVIYSLRFAPTFLHNLHHVIDDLAKVNNKLCTNKIKSSSLGRSAGPISGPSSRSTSSKDLLSLDTQIITKSKVQIVTEKFHELFMIMHNLEEVRRKEPSDAFQPNAFLQAIREANYIFEGNHQQDAHELLVYLLDNIRETCDLLVQQIQHHPEVFTVSNEAPVSNSNSNKLWNMKKPWTRGQRKKDKVKDSISEEQTVTDADDVNSVDCTFEIGNKKKIGYNFVAEDFEGVTLRRTKCLECECVTEIKEPFYDIPVPILAKDEDYYEDRDPCEVFRRACVTMEKLCDSNKYLCDNCLRYNEASREVSFEKLPNIMVLQLKRFTATTTSGVQKVNAYMPTPLEMSCFCDSCLQTPENEETPHRYQLCCVIMHLGGTLASGHYIAYVKASDPYSDYACCPRDLSNPKSGSEKSLNLLKYFKKENEKKNETKNNVSFCNSQSCCGVKLNRNVVNGYARRNHNGGEYGYGREGPMWLECDDENIKPITSQELREFLGYKPNSTSTPYLLFYSKVLRVDEQGGQQGAPCSDG